MLSTERHHRLFGPPYAWRAASTCVTGDGEVQSGWDKVASSERMVTPAQADVTMASLQAVGSQESAARSTRDDVATLRHVKPESLGATILIGKGVK
jgi:hypothetical protein